MKILKKILRPLLGDIIYRLRFRIRYYVNYWEDSKLFKKYSLTFTQEYKENLEAELILHYHAIEKGLLHREMKPGFAKYRVINLHRLLNNKNILKMIHLSQVRVGYQVMCQYYEVHQLCDFDIENFYSNDNYKFYKNVLSESYNIKFKGALDFKREDFYNYSQANFSKFAHSRKSVREFTGELIPQEILSNVIELANTSPSVCNRQASHIYLIENKNLIDRVLKIQGGLKGYEENIQQLLILTNDRKYYYTIGERNQLFVDGGIYLMNLLYALHYYEIGNCPANWAKTVQEEAEVYSFLRIPESEKIICMIPIGRVKNEFRTTLSQRRDVRENFHVINS